MAFLLNKTYVLSRANLDWLGQKMDSSFKIKIGSGSTIVFGYNGIGKTSLSKCLRDDASLNFRFLDYEEDPFADSPQKITIAPNIQSIRAAEEIIQSNEVQIDFAKLIKQTGFKKTKNSADPAFIRTFRSGLPTGSFSCVLKTDKPTYASFLSKYPNIKSKIFFDIASYLGKVSSSQSELASFRNAKLMELLEHAKAFTDHTNECPVCGTKFADINATIDAKKAALASTKSELISFMEEQGYPHDSATIDAYLALYSELESNSALLNDYAVCGQDINAYDLISNKIATINSNRIMVAQLNAEKVTRYNAIKAKKDRFTQDVSRNLHVPSSAIVFDDVKNEISITLNRDVKTYSTGERHLLWFLYQMYSFLGSDSPVLVLDDPASSLDLANLYKIAFEIVQNSGVSGKSLLVFTHSVDLVNAINSQRRNYLTICYIEELNGKLYCGEIAYKSGNLDNVFTLERLKGFSPKIVASLKRREDEGPNSPEHKVYHFNPDGNDYASQEDSSLTNTSLINLIDSHVSFTITSFYQDTFVKIHHLLALRVWLEKELFSLIPANDTATQNAFLNGSSLGAKIGAITNAPVDYLSLNGIKREDLMGKKVMLNQNAHFYSQVMPFAYAASLSFDDIEKEISELKSLFAPKSHAS